MNKILFFAWIILLFSCKTNKNSVTANANTCQTLGTVQDFAGLDGCGLLIVLENGDKLQPAQLPADANALAAGQQIKFNYKVIEDAMSICMAEKAIVELTCLEVISNGGKPIIAECADTKNPFEVDWMDRALDRHNPTQVVKYKYLDGFAYLFKSLPNSYFYDCQGNFLCQTNGNLNDDCHKKYMNTAEGKGKIIWQGEGIWDWIINY